MTSSLTNGGHLLLISHILFCHVVQVYSVEYELTAEPNNVRRGESLTITAQLINPTPPVGGVRLSLTKPGEQAVTIFSTRGCQLIGTVYQMSGRVTSCDTNNHRYVITFKSVTDDHVGSYRIQAPLQNPRLSQPVTVQLLIPPTNVTIRPVVQSVVAGQTVNCICAVDEQAGLPVTFKWSRIQNGNRVAVPSGAKTTPLDDATYGVGRAKKVEWRSGRQDGGEYQCQATNSAGSKHSSTATLNVYYPADSVNLVANATTVMVGTRVTLTCSSRGGNPRPGLVIYNVTSGVAPKELAQSSGDGRLTFSKVMNKYDDGSQYACKTKVNVKGIAVISSSILAVNVQGPPLTPSGFRVVGRTNDTVTLHWRSNSETEHQAFLLNVNSQRNKHRKIKVSQDQKNQSVVYVVRNLLPSTVYTFSVQFVNILNVHSNRTPQISVRTLGNLNDFTGFVIKRATERHVMISWDEMMDELVQDYSEAIVNVTYTVVKSPDEGSLGEMNMASQRLTEGYMVIKVEADNEYSFDILVSDNNGGLALKLSDQKTAKDTSSVKPVLIAVIICLVILLVLIVFVFLLILYRRGQLTDSVQKHTISDTGRGETSDQIDLDALEDEKPDDAYAEYTEIHDDAAPDKMADNKTAPDHQYYNVSPDSLKASTIAYENTAGDSNSDAVYAN